MSSDQITTSIIYFMYFFIDNIDLNMLQIHVLIKNIMCRYFSENGLSYYIHTILHNDCVFSKVKQLETHILSELIEEIIRKDSPSKKQNKTKQNKTKQKIA